MPNNTELIGFNSSFEVGLRALVILGIASSKNLDLQRLIYYDYLVIHSSDIGEIHSPQSIHPDTPHRSGGIIVRRKAMQEGLELMYSKSLINIVYDENGISYSASELTIPFLNLLESSYSKRLYDNAEWVLNYFSKFSDEELRAFIEKNINKWGGEFMYEAYVRGGIE
ncbi:ABC-three component system middle component 2 [Paenibacillus pedocola]|uniref:ABC-three component system middle component 2 n=1 Tax=Paenibacillus pedocola TaxID=3242193 RepID=UPI00287784EA|nr:ABC-three component system middle component 2 [Paenibacillus typhae]